VTYIIVKNEVREGFKP